MSRQTYVTVQEVLDDLPQLDVGESHPSIPNHTVGNHRQPTVERVASTEWGEELYDSWNGMVRLHPHGPSRTMDAGGSGRYQFGHYEQQRPLSIRERARIMSFPDTFVFDGDIRSMRNQTGNAVPPKLSESVAQEVVDGLY